MARPDVNEEYERIHHYLNEGLIFTGVFLIPGLFGAVAVGEGLLRVYGAEFAQGYYILILLITARIFDAYASQIVSVIRAVDKPDIALRIDMVFLGANISLNFLFVYTHGWYGAAVATLLSGIVTLGFGFYSLSTLIGRPTVPYMEIVKEIIAGGLMFTIVAFLTSILPSGYHITVLLIFCGIIVYTTVLIIASERIRQKVFILSPV
jgi:O-antigen/teichoic acid export membrane protein